MKEQNFIRKHEVSRPTTVITSLRVFEMTSPNLTKNVAKTFASAILIVFFVQYGCCATLTTIRETWNGPVEGVELISSLGQKYHAFKGIPFAEPPITGVDPYTGEKVDRRFKVCLMKNIQY